MASILKVNTIQDATNSNTALSLDTSGNVTVNNTLKSNGGYELIQSKMSTSHNQHAGGSAIEFQNVFSSDYISYKVIIGWFLNSGNSGQNVSLRFMTGTNTQVSGSSYRYVVRRFGDTDTNGRYYGNAAAQGVLWTTVGGETNGANGGIHGEFEIFGGSLGPTTLGGVSTQRYYANGNTDVYNPIVRGSMVGFSISGSEYEMQDSMIRLNSSQNPYHYTGFAILTSASGEAKGTHIAVYGLRSS